MHHTSSDNKVQRKQHQSNDMTNGRTTGMLALDPIILQFASNHATSARMCWPKPNKSHICVWFFYLSRKLDSYANARHIINAVAYNITVMYSVGDQKFLNMYNSEHTTHKHHPKTDSLRNQITCIIRSIFRALSNIRFALALYDFCQTICVCYCASFLCVCVTRCMTALKSIAPNSYYV